MGRRSRKRSGRGGPSAARPPATTECGATALPREAPPREAPPREPPPREVPPREVPPRRAAPPRTPPPPASRRARLEDAPQAPWSPFPLVELTILLGIVLIVLGFVGAADRRTLSLVCGFALVTLAGLELSLREHFTGYRSHSALLAGAAAVIVDVPLFFLTRLPQEILLLIGVAVFGGAFYALRGAFRRQTGGIGFRA